VSEKEFDMVAVNEITVLPIQLEELEILRPKERLSLLEWLETRYMLSGGTAAIEGFWSREYTPYFIEVAEWLNDTTTSEVWIYACAQSGKTTFGTGWKGWIVDCNPGPTMSVMPTKDDVRNRVEARIRPMFAANENLLGRVRGNVRNIFIGKQTVMDHMILYLAWPTTPAATADKPICNLDLDEFCKYPPFVGAEADPYSLFRKRIRWFKGRSKILGSSTPTIEDGPGDQEWKKGDRCDWWVKCVHCVKWHLLVWENIKIDKKKEGGFFPAEWYKSGRKSRYVCPKCGACWTEDDRWKAVCAGRWVPGDCQLDDNGRLIGEIRSTTIHSISIHALMLHPGVETVANLTAEFVNTQKAKKTGNIQPLKDFWNSQLARTWKEERATTDIEILRKHIGKYPKGKIPAGCQMLTAGLDVQLDHVFLRVLGWGYLGEFWSVFEERIETGPTDRVENLVKLIPYMAMRFELMADPDKVMRIALAAIDRQYNAESVDALCVRCAGVVPLIPVAGDDKLSKQAWVVGKTAGGFLKLYRLNVTAYKDALFRGYFEATVAGPGYGHLHNGTEHIVLEHLTSEKKIIERLGERIKWIGWVTKKPGLANHYWDCDVYARAAADIAGLWSLPDPSETKKDVTPIGRPVGRKAIRTKY